MAMAILDVVARPIPRLVADGTDNCPVTEAGRQGCDRGRGVATIEPCFRKEGDDGLDAVRLGDRDKPFGYDGEISHDMGILIVLTICPRAVLTQFEIECPA